MFTKSKHIALPRRIVAYYLLFGVSAIAWLTAGIFYVSNSVLQSRGDSRAFTVLGQASRVLALDYLQHGEASLQPLVEELTREQGLAYCAVVNSDGTCLAHSNTSMVQKKAPEPAGAAEIWGDIQRVRFVNDDSVVILEYRTPFNAGGRSVGSVRIGTVETGTFQTLKLAAGYAPLAILAPLALMAGGAVVVSRLVRPVSEIEGQLRRAAVAPSMTGCLLEEVKVSGPASVGWNRIVEHRLNADGSSSLDQRLSTSLQDVRARKLDGVLHSLTDGIATTDREGSITYANSAVVALLDRRKVSRREADEDRSDEPAERDVLPSDHLESASMFESLSRSWQIPEDSPLFDAESGQRNVIVELERHPDDDRRVLRITRSPARWADGTGSDGHVWTFRDITQQKMAEEMRSQFVDTATHELRTPLANIKAYAETLTLTDMIDVEQQKEFINTINSEATRLARFVDDLLSVSSMEVGSLSLSRTRIDLERMFGEVLQKVSAQMEEKNLTFEHHFPEKFPEPTWDKDKVAAAVINLIGNAVKYTPAGGRVELRVKATDEAVEISVEDTGIGIAEDEIPKLFEKFFRSSDPRVHEQPGTGLGLSLANEVVHLHGGKITIDSELNKGTTFLVTLPLT